MSWARPAALLLVALALAGCGGAERGGGQATLWVTHDRGETLVLETRVEAGQTLMRALRGVAKVETRYGGRYVQGVNGIEGSVASQRDWFWFVNGYEGDRSAAEYELRPGDIAWLDYRSWRDEDRAPIVVGAFPEPFLHGYGGRVRRAVVRFETDHMRAVALGLANVIGARSVEHLSVPAVPEANVLVVADESGSFHAALRSADGSAGSPVVFRVSFEDAKRLLKDPELAHRRYEGLSS